VAQRSLKHQIPNVQGSSRYGFDYLSFIKSDTAFKATGGLSGAAVEGQLRYDESEHNFKYWNGSADTAVAVASASGAGLDGAYDLYSTINVDGTTVTLAGSNADVLTVTQSADDDNIIVTKTGEGAGNLIKLANSGTGDDIQGTGDTWAVTAAGAATFTSLDGVGDITVEDITATSSSVSITTDATSGVAVALEMDTLTTGTALEIDSNTGANCKLLDLQNAGTSCFIVSGSGVVTIAGSAKNTDAIVITDGDITLTDGDLDLSSGQFSLVSDQAGAGMTITDATSGNYDLLYLNGTTNDGSGNILSIDQGAATRTGNMVQLDMGTTAVAMSAIDITCTGGTRTAPIISMDSDGTASDFIYCHTDVAFSGNMIDLEVKTGAATGNCIFINNDSGTSMEAINIDDEANIEDVILISATGDTGAGNALINLVADGTPNATANALLINWTGITDTGTPYAQKIDCSGVDAGALIVDSDAVTDHIVSINCGGALADDKAVLNLSIDGKPASGMANYLRIDASGADSTNVPTAIEVVGSGETMQGLYIDTDGTNKHQNHFHGGGALTDGLGVVGISSDGALAAGGNVLNVTYTGTPAATSVAAVEVLCAKDCMALDIASSAVGVNCARIVGSGALTDGLAVLSLSSAAALAAGGNILNLTYTGTPADETVSVLEIAAAKNCMALDIASSAVDSNCVRIIGSGALTDGLAVLSVSSAAALATGGNLLNLTYTGTPAAAAVSVVDIVCAKDCKVMDITTSAASVSALKVTGIGAINDNLALLELSHSTGTIASGGSLLRLEGTTAATATAYGMTINCTGANLEGLWVEHGDVLIAENLEVTGTSVFTGQIDAHAAGIRTELGTTADLSATPTDAELSTAFGVENKTLGGFIGVVEDSGDGKVWIAVSDGTTWHVNECIAAGA